MTDDELKDPKNWWDFGLTEHLEDTSKFPRWLDIAREAIRILGAENSPGAALIETVAAAAAKVGFDDD